MARRRKYERPEFLNDIIDQAKYERWLQRKAVAHVRRDRWRGNTTATNAKYKEAIHAAVIECGSRDFYTGEKLDWSLLSAYDNDLSKAEGRVYKAGFGYLPTVDHVNDGRGPADFKICAWRTNDAKNDMTYKAFVELCKTVVRYCEQNNSA